jgi:predicted negative regulator of RcsB-dependent stress response
MQIELGIPLIICGFLIPILGYFLWRRYSAKKQRERLLSKSELFDKEGDRVGIVEDGDVRRIPARKSTVSLQIAVVNQRRMR